MSKVAILTDSNSGITQAQAEQMGVTVIPMPFFIDGVEYLEDINLSQEEFYEKLNNDADISTSQPSIGTLQDYFDKLLKDNDEVVFIPMSSGLSGTCQTATMVAGDYDGKEIKNILEAHKMDSSIYITLETLKYLKKGGRITPAAAAIGTMLKLNPVLQIQGEKLDAYAKARGKASAKKIMLKAMKEDMEKRFADYADTGRMHIEVAYTGNVEEAKEWAEAVKEAFPQFDFHMDPLSLSVACHIGYGSLAIATSAYVPEAE